MGKCVTLNHRNRWYNHNKTKSWWRHQMEIFFALLALCAGNSPVTGELPSQRPVMQKLMFSLICAWINGWVNNREAGDLRRHRAHYDVIVMSIKTTPYFKGHIARKGLTDSGLFIALTMTASASPRRCTTKPYCCGGDLFVCRRH